MVYSFYVGGKSDRMVKSRTKYKIYYRAKTLFRSRATSHSPLSSEKKFSGSTFIAFFPYPSSLFPPARIFLPAKLRNATRSRFRILKKKSQLTDEIKLDPCVPRGRLPEVDPAPEHAPVLDPERLDAEVGLDDGGAGLAVHARLVELEVGAVAEGAVVPPVAPVLALSHVEAGERGEAMVER